MGLFGDIITIGTIIGVGITVVAKFLPNPKVYKFGYNIGVALTSFGTSKIGKAWEKIEDFLTNSLGIFFTGMKDGLNSDEENPTYNPPKDDGPKVRV